MNGDLRHKLLQSRVQFDVKLLARAILEVQVHFEISSGRLSKTRVSICLGQSPELTFHGALRHEQWSIIFATTLYGMVNKGQGVVTLHIKAVEFRLASFNHSSLVPQLLGCFIGQIFKFSFNLLYQKVLDLVDLSDKALFLRRSE